MDVFKNIKMDSKSKVLLIFVCAYFVLYSAVLFIIFGFAGHNSSFWTSYAFTAIGWGVSLVTCYKNFQKGFTFKDWFFGYPALRWAGIYLALQTALSFLFMLLPGGTYKFTLIVQLLLLAAFVVIVTSCMFAKEVAIQDSPGLPKVQIIRVWVAQLDTIARQTADSGVKAQIMRLSEAARYSDPMSDESLARQEADISQNIQELEQAVGASDYGLAARHLSSIEALLLQRNNMLRALKQ